MTLSDGHIKKFKEWNKSWDESNQTMKSISILTYQRPHKLFTISCWDVNKRVIATITKLSCGAIISWKAEQETCSKEDFFKRIKSFYDSQLCDIRYEIFIWWSPHNTIVGCESLQIVYYIIFMSSIFLWAAKTTATGLNMRGSA